MAAEQPSTNDTTRAADTMPLHDMVLPASMSEASDQEWEVEETDHFTPLVSTNPVNTSRSSYDATYDATRSDAARPGSTRMNNGDHGASQHRHSRPPRQSTFWKGLGSLLPGTQLPAPPDGPAAAQDPTYEDETADDEPLLSGRGTPPTQSPISPDLEQLVAAELKTRMDVYAGLTLLSALLVTSTFNLVINLRNSHQDAMYPGVGIAAELCASTVLSANIFGAAIILLQKHKVGVYISRKRYREAIQGWRRLWPQRERAVWAITYSLPGLLVTGSLYMIAGEEVTPGNWAAFSLLASTASFVVFSVTTMESEFIAGSKHHRDLAGMLAWTAGADRRKTMMPSSPESHH
eukprot:m.11985 g.11985  ORF g.11985 m.11985 type:complete len:349 (+) comp2897_c0_seq2:213-1259(+)